MFKFYVTVVGAFYCAALALNVAHAVRDQVNTIKKEASDEA